MTRFGGSLRPLALRWGFMERLGRRRPIFSAPITFGLDRLGFRLPLVVAKSVGTGRPRIQLPFALGTRGAMARGGVLAPGRVGPVADRNRVVVATHGLTERQQGTLAPPVITVIPVDHCSGTCSLAAWARRMG
ncbi:hypothetical protein [Mesorhizobium sp. M2E.F.Ca.ET.209.01.1.1]|uniref:hypothetical protein n=1 Tax=Mesorhizobium sp. M2E.F.Ca.ET.209.01.1.1 TaxID=2500526 RepID=UPI001FEF6E3F|nr:hypothetical protein [Mesorhizobium sp. M2E.F.Ca.ET.209.01.1.1]